MTRFIKLFQTSLLLGAFWLGGTSMALAQCADSSNDPDAPLLSPAECYAGNRAIAIISEQPDVLARRNAQSNGIGATQNTGMADLGGYSGPLWATLSGRWSTRDDADLDLGIATIGSDVFVGETTILGLMLQNDFSFQDGPVGNSYDSTGYMLGVYGIVQSGELNIDARLLAGQSKTDVAGGGDRADDVKSARWLASVQVSGQNQFDNGNLLIPHISVGWFEDTMDEYTLGFFSVDEDTVSYGQADIGGTLLMPVTLGGADGNVVLAASGIKGFGGDAGEQIPDDLRGRIDLGLEFFRSDAWSVSAKVFADGLGQDDYEAVGADFGVMLWF